MTVSDLQKVTAVHHWTDSLFSFRVTRPASLRFRSGEFVMIGLPDENGKPIMRAYSIASPAWEEELEFYSIKVPDGPLTSRLQNITAGDDIILRPKSVGTLVHDAILPGRRLWFLATGTGFAPFASLLRDPHSWEAFDEIVVLHTCRDQPELHYGQNLIAGLQHTPLIDELIEQRRLHIYGATTRQQTPRMGRITDNLASGKIYQDLAISPLDPDHDRLMICGSYAFNIDVKALLEGLNFVEGSNTTPGHFVIEKAFVGEGM